MNWQAVHPVSIDLILPPVVSPVVVLIGPPGVGKTTVGGELAHRLGYQFYDADELIEKGTRHTVSQIFQKYGEVEFRRLESELLALLKEARVTGEALRKTGECQLMNEAPKGTVLSTGAGMPVKPENLSLLLSLGYLVYLSAPLEVLTARLANSQERPLLNSERLQSEERLINKDEKQEGSEHFTSRLKELLLRRQQTYEQAQLFVDTQDLSVSQVVQRIVDLLPGEDDCIADIIK